MDCLAGNSAEGRGFAAEIADRPGLIPVSIDPLSGQLIWEDLQRFHCYEGFFHQSLDMFRILSKTPPFRISSKFDADTLKLAQQDSLVPAGFIFHAGRCGTTLLVRALARSRSNLVFSEAAPHNQFWDLFPDDVTPDMHLFRNLVIGMGRRRIDSYRAHIIKFTSHQILHFRLIRAAFPEVPALFLFRAPDAIARSFVLNPPRWIRPANDPGEFRKSLEVQLEQFFKTAAELDDNSLRFLDHSQLIPEVLPSILNFFNLHPVAEELAAMTGEFSWDSKQVLRRARLRTDHATQSVSPALEQFYARLVARAGNSGWSRD